MKYVKKLRLNNKNICAMKNILVPCDFSKPAVNAFRTAVDLARKSKGSILLLHVIELPTIQDPIVMPAVAFEGDFRKEMTDATNTRFEKLIARYNTGGMKITTQVAFNSAMNAIQDVTRKKKIDLVVMGTHGATGLREYLIGSNAEKIVRHSPVPVLAVKNYFKG